MHLRTFPGPGTKEQKPTCQMTTAVSCYQEPNKQMHFEVPETCLCPHVLSSHAPIFVCAITWLWVGNRNNIQSSAVPSVLSTKA